jgi:hypothetical protein
LDEGAVVVVVVAAAARSYKVSHEEASIESDCPTTLVVVAEDVSYVTG